MLAQFKIWTQFHRGGIDKTSKRKLKGMTVMAIIKAAILGFGTVGQGIYHILNEKREELKDKLGIELEVTKILVTDVSRERVPGTAHLMTTSMDEVLADQVCKLYLRRLSMKNQHIVT